MLVLGWVAFIAICALAILMGNVAMGQSAYVPSGSQAPSRSRSLFDDEMAPGVIGAIQLQPSRNCEVLGKLSKFEVQKG
jgi:hypothetical protein